MTLLLMVANVQNRDDKLGFSDTATDVLALDIVPNEKPFYKKCHVKVLNIGDTSNQSSNSANSLFKDAGRVNGFWNTLESHSKNIEVNTTVDYSQCGDYRNLPPLQKIFVKSIYSITL